MSFARACIAAGKWTCQVQKYDRLYAVNGQASEKSKDM